MWEEIGGFVDYIYISVSSWIVGLACFWVEFEEKFGRGGTKEGGDACNEWEVLV